MNIPERLYSPGHNCPGCTSPGECDASGGCQVEDEEIAAAINAEEEDLSDPQETPQERYPWAPDEWFEDQLSGDE